MIIIGELINASRKAIKAAIEAQDADAIKKLATDQAEAGASYIDVNAGIFVGKEPEYLTWLVETVQDVELRHREAREAVNARRVANDHAVERAVLGATEEHPDLPVPRRVAEGRIDYARQFFQHLIDHYADSAEAASARNEMLSLGPTRATTSPGAMLKLIACRTWSPLPYLK